MTLKQRITPLYNKFLSLESFLFPRVRSKKLFKKMVGTKCNLKNPSTFNEKLMYYKLNLYWNNKLVAECADKYRVRQFVKENGLEQALNPLYGCYDKFEDIDWDNLPNKFAIKLNTGSGCNLICKDKSSFDVKAARKTIKKWFKQKHGLLTAEQGIYQYIDKKIIIEKYIETENDLPPNDYKIFCSYGEPKLLFVASDRYEGKTKFDFYTTNWEWIPVKNSHPNAGPINKPNNLELMLKYASILSKKFPLVRIDFYSEQGNIIFGEMTFSHMGCVHPFDPQKFDKEFGLLFPEVTKANRII